MFIDIRSTYENTSPFMGLNSDIENSFLVIKSYINDVKLLVDQKERLLKENLESINSESLDQSDEINYRSEKIDIFITQMNLTFNNSSFLLIISQLEIYLKEISDLGEKLIPKKVDKVQIKRDTPFGQKWKLKFNNVLKAESMEHFNQDWELLTCIYNIRSKITHENSIISLDLNDRIKEFDLDGLHCFNNNSNSTNYSITISPHFLFDIIQRFSQFLKNLLQAIYTGSIDKMISTSSSM